METTTMTALEIATSLPSGYTIRVTPRPAGLGLDGATVTVTYHRATKAGWRGVFRVAADIRRALRAEHPGLRISRKIQVRWSFDSGFTPRAFAANATMVVAPAIPADH